MEPSRTPKTRLDRRIHRTRRLLTQALIDLTLAKGYEAVSIRDLTERADVGYATFFRHYKDKDALLADVLEQLIEELLALLQPLAAEAHPARIGTLVFKHADQNSALYQVLLSSPASGALLPRLYELATEAALATVRVKPDSPVPAELAAHHLIASFLALIQWWLQRHKPYPPEQMGRIYAELVLKPTQALAFVNPSPKPTARTPRQN